MLAAILTIAMSACQGYAERVAAGDPDILAVYHAACATALEVDGGGFLQVSACTVERDGSTDCNWHTYGTRRLPFEPRVRY